MNRELVRKNKANLPVYLLLQSLAFCRFKIMALLVKLTNEPSLEDSL